jgi:hypothetical protein
MTLTIENEAAEEQVTEKHSDSPENNPEHKRKIAGAQASKAREKQALELQRERILSERTSSPHRRAALHAALADVESRLGTLA